MVFPGDPPIPTGSPPAATTSPSPTGPSTPAAAPSPTSAAIAYGPVTVATGSLVNTYTDMGDPMTGPDGSKQFRDFPFIGIDTVNDPSVSGIETESWNLDLWGDPSVDYAATQWGTVRLENDDGTWEGKGAGIFDTRGDLIALWYTGTGAYAGLAYFELIGPSMNGPEADDWSIQGQIFSGAPPKP